KVGQDLVAHLLRGLFVGRLLLLPRHPAEAAQHGADHDQESQLFPVHCAFVFCFRMTARAMPTAATTKGMPAMFRIVVRNWSESISCCNLRRVFFSSLLASARLCLNFSISSCCSRERMCRWPSCFLPWSSPSLWLASSASFCSLAISAW